MQNFSEKVHDKALTSETDFTTRVDRDLYSVFNKGTEVLGKEYQENWLKKSHQSNTKEHQRKTNSTFRIFPNKVHAQPIISTSQQESMEASTPTLVSRHSPLIKNIEILSCQLIAVKREEGSMPQVSASISQVVPYVQSFDLPITGDRCRINQPSLSCSLSLHLLLLTKT